jgi:hypothetical protein
VPVDDLGAVVTALAEQLGERVGDLDDEHERWRIVQRAVQCRVRFDLVFRVVGLERDQSMAESVVVSVLEVLPDSEHAAWIDQLAPNHRRYCHNRSAEIAIVRGARSGGYDAEELAAHLDNWSDWVQRRLVPEVDLPPSDGNRCLCPRVPRRVVSCVAGFRQPHRRKAGSRCGSQHPAGTGALPPCLRAEGALAVRVRRYR